MQIELLENGIRREHGTRFLIWKTFGPVKCSAPLETKFSEAQNAKNNILETRKVARKLNKLFFGWSGLARKKKLQQSSFI